MKKLLLLSFCLLVFNALVFADATKTVGGSGGADYATLKLAFDDINGGLNGMTGAITLNVISSTTEAAAAQLNASGTGVGSSYSSILIQPTATNLVINGSATTNGTIFLNGAQNVTIDGRIGGTGSTKDLTIVNTASAASGVPAIRFADASSNTVRYCTLRANNENVSSTAGGVLLITFTSTGSTNNTIDYCDIDANSSAFIGVVIQGGTTTPSTGNTISNCNIYDFYGGSVSTTQTLGLRCGSTTSNTTITGNSFYQTVSRLFSSTANSHEIIQVNSSSSNGYVITNNYLGGNGPNGGSGSWTVTGGAYRVYGMNLAVGSTTATSIQGNTISNFDITTAYAVAGNSGFIGMTMTAGAINIGTITGNTIGSLVANDKIKVKFTGATGSGVLIVGINMTVTQAALNVQNNSIGGITGDCNSTTNSCHIYPMSIAGNNTNVNTGLYTISNNTIGGSSLGSITNQNSTYTTGTTNIQGIRVAPVTNVNMPCTITNNTIQNLNYNSSGAKGQVVGIFATAVSGTASTGDYTITGNTVRNLINTSSNTGTVTAASVIGILDAQTIYSAGLSQPHQISLNKVYNLGTTNATGAQSIIGIYCNLPNGNIANVAERNLIRNLYLSNATTTTSSIYGFYITQNTASLTLQNNMISLGFDAAGNPMNIGYAILGILETGFGSSAYNYYFNSVYVGGTSVSGTTSSTYAFNSGSTNTNTRNYKNNIFVNVRAGGSTGKHYAVKYAGTIPGTPGAPTGLTANYNIYLNGTGGNNLISAGAGPSDYTLAGWQTATLQDANSVFGDPNFTSSTDLHIPTNAYSPANNAGITGTGVTNDFDGDTRSGTPDIGADEYTYVPQLLSGDYYIPKGTNANGYLTLAAAITDLNLKGSTGGVRFLIDDNLSETGSPSITTSTLSGTNALVIKPNTGKSPTVTFSGCLTSGNNAFSGLTIDGTTCPGYITIDGSNTNGGTTKDMTFTINDATNGRNAIQLFSNADNVLIKNLVIKSQAIYTGTASAAGITALGGTTAGLVADNLTITNCQIGEALAATLFLYGINISNGSGGATYAGNVLLTNNTIYASARAMNLLRVNKTGSTCAISGNTISLLSTNTQGFTHAGIYLEQWQDVVNIFNNKLVTLKMVNNHASSAFTLYGIHTRAGQASSIVNIYNNFISDFYLSGTITTNSIYGIEAGATSNLATHNIYYNSVYLNNDNFSPNTGTFACLHSASTTAALVNAKDNILKNTIDNINSYVVKVVTNSNWNTSDYNDLYKTGASAKLGLYTTDQADLSAWKSATSKDANSISAEPLFLSPTDLHINTSGATSPVANVGTTIAGYTTDYDGDTRTSTPDIGADEFITYALTVQSTVGGTITVPATSPIQVNPNVANTITAIANVGYTFTGWTVVTGSGVTFGNAANLSTTVTLPSSDATVQANFTINSYTVTFDANTGSGTMSNQSANYNTPTALTLNAFTKTGYSFAGWNTAADGSGTAYADGANYSFTASITLYAQWTINQYTVTFSANTGTGTMSNQSANYNTPTALTLNAFTKTGYSFAGWNTAADGSGTAYADGVNYSFSANITLYAQWTIQQFTVVFDANAGTGTMSNQNANYNTPTALTLNAFTKTGYSFTGWNTAADGSGTAYADGANYSFTASITLYAQWTINQYTVTFDANTGTGTMSNQSANYNTPTALTLNGFTKTGYSFAGWNTKADGSGNAYANGANYHFTADTTMYAQWTINQYTVTFDANTGTGTMSSQSANYNTPTALTLNAFTKTGFSFAGWNTKADGSGNAYANGANYHFTADTTMYAQWIINQYTVTFNANTGTGTMSNQSANYNTPTALTLNAFTKTGYSFAGWNTAADGSGTAYADGANYNFTASITLYAQWTPNPVITVSVSSLTGFSSSIGTPSAAQSYDVSGAYLTNNIIITPPADFEICLTQFGTYQTSAITLTQTGGNVNTTTIWVRMNSPVVGSPSGNVTNTSIGAVPQNVAVSGNNALPVELSSFIAAAQVRNVNLSWVTKTEVNSSLFEIERQQSNSSKWLKIGEVIAAGNSNSTKEYTFTDRSLTTIKYQYRLKMVDADGRFEYSDVVEAEIALPTEYAISQNYPNPFNPSAKIDYQLPFDSKVTLELYGITGEKIATLINSDLSAGYYTADINASSLNLASGVYIYRMVATGGNNQTFTQVKKLMLTK